MLVTWSLRKAGRGPLSLAFPAINPDFVLLLSASAFSLPGVAWQGGMSCQPGKPPRRGGEGGGAGLAAQPAGAESQQGRAGRVGAAPGCCRRDGASLTTPNRMV